MMMNDFDQYQLITNKYLIIYLLLMGNAVVIYN